MGSCRSQRVLAAGLRSKLLQTATAAASSGPDLLPVVVCMALITCCIRAVHQLPMGLHWVHLQHSSRQRRGDFVVAAGCKDTLCQCQQPHCNPLCYINLLCIQRRHWGLTDCMLHPKICHHFNSLRALRVLQSKAGASTTRSMTLDTVVWQLSTS